MTKSLLLSVPFLIALSAHSQTAPAIEWEHSFGSLATDVAWSIQQSSDGGYIMASTVAGNSGNVTGFHGGFSDAWIAKLDVQGSLQWQQAWGGSGGEGVGAILQSSDGGYIMAGSTYSNDGDVVGNHGGADAWLIKLEPDGGLGWSRTYGGTHDDVASAIQQTNDGGYIIAGESRSTDGDVDTNNHGGNDCWILKLDAEGNMQWNKCLGGSGYDAAYSIQQASDGGYVFAGETSSNDGDVTGNHGGDGMDCWVVKLDDGGNIEWQHALGGTGNDIAHSVQQTNDGGYIVAGEVDSGDGDVTGYYGLGDFWSVKLDPAGGIQWQQCYGGSSLETAQDVVQLSDDGYIITGSTRSEDGEVTGQQGGQMGDVWIVRTDASGQLLWQKTIGGSASDGSLSIQKSSNGGYIMAGFSDSNDGDVTGNHGGRDCWVVKLSPDNVGIAEPEVPHVFSLSPNPARDVLNIHLEQGAPAAVQIKLLAADGRYLGTWLDGRAAPASTDPRFSVGQLPAGTYAVQISNSERSWTQRFVKM